MPSRRPVITGTGIISAAGCGVTAVWESVRTGRTGLGPLTLFASPRFANHPVGQVRADVDALAGRVRGSRSDKLCWLAAREAWAAAGLAANPKKINPVRTGVMVGATVGGMPGAEQFLTTLLREHQHRLGPLRFHECAGAADLCAQQIGARGPVTTLSTACSAGAMALLAAAELIAQGEADVVLAGATDSLARLTVNGFGSLLLLDPHGCRPFDARRTGISLGEGAAMLVVEAEETAVARGAKILARLAGWGASCDAFHATAPQPDGLGALQAMQRALERGGVTPAQVDFVSAHGTATPDNDAMEARALKQLFGDHVPPFSSVKGLFGHTLAASGAIKAVLAVQSLGAQAVPGTAGFEVPDEKLGLEPVRVFRAQRVDRLLSNSFGFGGNNVALLFERPGVPPVATATARIASPPNFVTTTTGSKWFAVLGVGVISPAGKSLTEIARTVGGGGAATSWFDVPALSPGARAQVYAAGEPDPEQLLEPGRRRRLSRLQQMAVVAAHQALRTTSAATLAPERMAVAIGTGLGALNDTAAFVENMILKEERAPRPALFTNSVHNALASQVAIECRLAGLNSTPVQREICFETALWQAATELAGGRADLALAGAADELNQYHLAAGRRWGWWPESSPAIRPFANALAQPARPLPGEGCTLFALGRADGTTPPLALVSAIRIGRRETNDAAAEAAWILETLRRDGVAPDAPDLLLTGANGLRAADEFYQAVAAALSRLAGRPVACGAYKQSCGEFHSASAFGLLTAIGLVRGEIAAKHPCKTIVLLTLSPTGTKGMCCVRA